MKITKIIHTSDIHLDTSTKTQQTFIQIVNACIKNKVSILIIAGDFFDTPFPEKKVINFVIREFKKLKKNNISIFLIPGNNDPNLSGSVWRKTKFPENVFFFNKAGIKRIQEIDIYGFPYISDLISPIKSGFSTKDYAKIKIGMMHGSFVAKGNKIKSPITLAQINQSNLDYLAIGHFHDFSKIKSKAKTYYAGSPVPGYGYTSTKPSINLLEIKNNKILVKRVFKKEDWEN
ncbi:MAG: DNA repair exonuclease [Candidatus Nanoarchaeia archaeon]